MALVPVKVSVVTVRVSVDIKASNTNISDVLSASIEPSDLLDVLSIVLSGDSSIVVVVPSVVVVLDRDGHSSVSSRSDRSSSPVEDPPLLDVFWEVVSDSKSILTCTDVLSIEDSSVGLHDRFDLELDTILKWVLRESDTRLVDIPLLVETIVAWIEDGVLLVSVLSSINIKADAGMVDETSSSEGDLLVWLVFPWSGDSSIFWSMLIVHLVGDCVVSLLVRSNGLSS